MRARSWPAPAPERSLSSPSRLTTAVTNPTSRVLFLFVDGLGLSAERRSPLHTCALPALGDLTHGFAAEPFTRRGVAYRVLDATLGVDGLPQSATGQATLLTGVNAAQLLGRHQGPHPGTTIQTLLREQSLHAVCAAHGRAVLHANGYKPEYLARVLGSRRNMLSAFAFAAQGIGLPLLPLDDPRAHWPGYWSDAAGAARALATTAQGHDLTVLEYWALDFAGHREPTNVSVRLGELDVFVGAFLAAAPDVTLVLTSDHGNAEEPCHGRHSRNPVPFLVCGPGAATVPDMTSLVDVAGWMRELVVGR